VTFDANGGKGTMPQQIFVADTPQPLNPNTFKRDGYVFTEWNTTADGKGVTYLSGSYYSLTSDIKLYAQWNAEEEKKEDEETPDNPEQTYSVTYKSQYGTVPSKISGLKKGDTLTEEQLAGITAGGYTFAGWYNGENKIEAGYTITCDLELTAKWDADTDTGYTVEHYQQNANDDEYTLAETENQTGATGENTFATAKTYAGFTVKSVEQTKNAENGSTVVKIYYDRNIITLTLNLDGGEGKTEIAGKYGATVNVTVPTKNGYTFAGWDSELPATFTEDTAYTLKSRIVTTAGRTNNADVTFTTEAGQRLYGSVNGETKRITKFYGSVNGETKEITKLYGSVNGETKRIF
jgi:uncharacterized repeat protein (TIGR02543 family)